MRKRFNIVRLVVLLAVLALALLTLYRVPRIKTLMALADLERRADLHFQNGETQQAESAWRRVLEADADAAGARNKLAVLCMRDARFEEAEALLDEGIRLSPKTTSFHYNLGLLRYMQGDHRGALEALSRVEAINPGHGEVHYMKGIIYEDLGQEDLAEKEFIAELNVDPATPAAWARISPSLRPDVINRGWLNPGGNR